MSDMYTCAKCGGTYEKGWTDEESLAECFAIFGEVPIEDRVLVCDDCWEEIRPRYLTAWEDCNV